MKSQRLRNLTTGRLHTSVSDIQDDIDFIVGETGIMTHMIPDAYAALMPWLKEAVTDPRYWDGAYDPSHDEEYDLSPMSKDQQQAFWSAYGNLPSSLASR